MGIFDSNDPEYAVVFAREAAMVDASELIAEALERSGLSRTELANKLQIAKSEVTARLKGERNITVRTLAETLLALDTELQLSSRPAAHSRDARSDRLISLPYERMRRRSQSSHRHNDRAANLSVAEVKRHLSGAQRA